MIVMGTNNRQGFSRLVIGSTAEHVLREAHIPVLVLKKVALRTHASGSTPPAH
jgi:nucleotide-binding universal stress UspA family protein